MTHFSRDIGCLCWNYKLVKMTRSCGKSNGFGLDRVVLCWFKLLNVPSACREWDRQALYRLNRGGIFLATRLGCVSGLATHGIVCKSRLVGLDPPDNCVPEFVASDPKLWDVGNRLVGVDHAFAFI
jgi:hypothetical protein